MKCMTSNTLFFFLLSLTLPLSSTTEGFCPDECHCGYQNVDFYVDCSRLGLTELPYFPDVNVQMLDLSENLFTFIPPQLAQFPHLKYLDLSSNLISSLPPYSLEGLHSLKQLNLGNNNISNWASIFPNQLLQNTLQLEELSLARNAFTSFSSNEASLVLTSPSLRYLDLSNCKITKVSGVDVLFGLRNLEHLKLSGNPIRSLSDLKSATLRTLDLSGCNLGYLQPTTLAGLESLSYINLARNHRLSLSFHGNVNSSSLTRINLSHCNMDSIELAGFPNLLTAILRGNMIRQLTRDNFAANPLIESIDLSSNAISLVASDSFRQLTHLKHLDLSFNMIPRIDGKTFKDNDLLTHINLSRNYIDRLQRLVANSLAHLNMSFCELQSIDPDALGAMPSLIDLDLSSNLLSADPENLESETLQTLDLSMCRLTSIRNTTFAGLPALLRINLSGNRFTTPFRVEFFEHNPYLSEIWLGDNPWRCDCRDPAFQDLYIFLNEPPRRGIDRKLLRCTSPEDFYGATWDAACRSVWYPQDVMGTTEKIWTYFMLAILAFFGFFCLYSSVKRFIDSRRKLAAERQRRENIEELREVARENHLRLRQDAQQNAPDARESRPPCYEDAILLPKLDAASFASLDELLLRGKRKKKRKQRASTSEEPANANEENDEEVQLRPSDRSRSENVLSIRSAIYQQPNDALNNQSPIYQRPMSNRAVTATVVANVHASPNGSRVTQAAQRSSNNTEEVYYHSTDILGIASGNTNNNSTPAETESTVVPVHTVATAGPSHSHERIHNFNDRSYENSPYAKRKVKPLQHLNPNGSIEEITDFEDSDSSPYAKRRIKHMSSFKGDHKRPALPTSAPPALDAQQNDSEIIVVEDYFQQEKQKELDDYAILADIAEQIASTSGTRDNKSDADLSDSSSIEVIQPKIDK